MKIETTGRGFQIITFEDRYGQPCSLQESSLADGAHVWLGVSKRTDLNTGAELADSKNFRMHLSRDHVRELLPHLIAFAETGGIAITEGA